MWRRGLRERRRASGAVVAAGVMALLAGCTPPGLPEPLAPSGPSSTPGTPPEASTVVVGLTGRPGGLVGFNPYVVSDYAPASTSIAQLVLPSAFVLQPDGDLAPDPAVVDAARVTATDPFTVTYTLDAAASWSDGTPVSAEDFSYLRTQLIAQPGTVSSAPYRLIQDIRSRDAGKTVEVEFVAEAPGWQTMFSPLLPSHLMKDFPGGWTAALAATIPVSGNRYRLMSYDPLTGQVTLRRNDKYWGPQPNPETVVLRLGSAADLVEAFTRGDVQALWLRPAGDEISRVESAVPSERRRVIATPASVQLVFNTRAGPTAVAEVRRAVAAALDPTDLALTLAEGWTGGGLAVTSQVRLPAQEGSDGPDIPTDMPVITDDLGTAERLLTDAGFARNGLYVAADGLPLRVTLGAPSGDTTLLAAAHVVQRQLGGAGIEVDVLADTVPSLLTRVTEGELDLALLTVPRGSDDAIAAATAFSCPVVPGIDGGVPLDPLVPAQARPAEAEAEVGAPDADAVGVGLIPDPGGNLAGFCSPEIQPVLADAITGSRPVYDADPELWDALPVLPLVQNNTVFAVSSALSSVLDGPTTGWLWTGPLAGLPDWPVP